MKSIVVTGREPERKLVAVVTGGGEGIFFKYEDRTVFFNLKANMVMVCETSLERAYVFNRVPVYEGDTVTIHF